MRRFIFGISTSIICIAIGMMITVFELKDFRFVSAYATIYKDSELYDTVVNEEEPLRIDLDDDVRDVNINFDLDETLKDKVEIEISDNIEHSFKNNRLKVTKESWIRLPFGKYVDVLMDGLKEEKIYYLDHYNDNSGSITIRCSKKTRDNIRVND